MTLRGGRSAPYETKSDAAGHFKITGVSPGDYHADAEKYGFLPLVTDVGTLLARRLHVAAAGDRVTVEIKLTQPDTIHGRVLDPEGKPFAGVEVSLDPNITADNAITDQEGRFTLADLRPGSYLLIARPPQRVEAQKSSDGSRTAIVTTYYPSAVDPSLAQHVVLSGLGGADYEIRMQIATVHRVRGIVLNEEGKPSPEAELNLLQIPEANPEPLALSQRTRGLGLFAMGLRPRASGTSNSSVIADKDGHFEFPAVRSGNWRIFARPRNAASRGSADVFVGRTDVGDVKINFALPFKFVGTVERNGEGPESQTAPDSRPASGEVYLINPDRNEFVAGGLIQFNQMFFDIPLPGRYKAIIRPGLSAQIFLGENEALGQTFPVSADGPPLRLVLKTWAGTVRGTVEKGDGATVVLIPQRFEGVAFGQTVICGPSGSFELNQVSPGDYYIAAFDHMDGLSPSAAILSLVPTRGTSVKVEEHSAKDVNLSVIVAPR